METREQTFEKLIQVHHTMGALRHQRHRAEGGGDPSRGRGRILALLKLRDGIATKDIAQVLGIRVSSLNEVLAKLERDELVERRASEADGRVMLVYLTDAGREAAPEASGMPDVAFRDFGGAELDAFGGYLDRIAANLEAELDDDTRAFMERGREMREEFRRGRGPQEGGPFGGRRHRGGPHGRGPHDRWNGDGHGPHGDERGLRDGRGGHGRGCGDESHDWIGGGPDSRFRHETPTENGSEAQRCIADCRACTLASCIRR